MHRLQDGTPESSWNYSFVEYARKAYNLADQHEADPKNKEQYFNKFQWTNAMKNYYTESINEINHLVQLDRTSHLELKESKWEVYKISLSFSPKGILTNDQ